MLPIMVCLDGFILSHGGGRGHPEQEVVDRFLPKLAPLNTLDPYDPVMVNPITPPEFATEMRYQQDRAMEAARTVIGEADEEFATLTGRRYGGFSNATAWRTPNTQ